MNITRRSFLGAAAVAAVAPSVGSAIEPIARTNKSTFKLSLAAYSMRKYLDAASDAKGAINMEGFVDYCAGLGIHGAELTSYYFPKKFDTDYLMNLRRRAYLAGLSISGGAIGNDFAQPDGEKLKTSIAHTKMWIDYYAELGAPAIRVFSGGVPSGDTEEATIARCAKVFEDVCEYAGKKGIFLALENHGGLTAEPKTMLKLVKAVKSPWFGVNLDTGNFHSDDPYAELVEIAPYAVNVQVKVELRRKGKKHDPADLKRFIDILREAKYSGWVVLEYEAAEDPYEAIPKHLDTLKRLIAS